MKPDHMNAWEIWLAIYSIGFALDKFASVLGKQICLEYLGEADHASLQKSTALASSCRTCGTQ